VQGVITLQALIQDMETIVVGQQQKIHATGQPEPATLQSENELHGFHSCYPAITEDT